MKFIILFCLTTSALASDKIFKIKDQSVIVSNENGIMANRDCIKSKSTCSAYVTARKFAQTKVQSSGKNPHSVKCKDILKGEVVIGIVEAGNENSFCLFPDQSVISCSSLNQF